MLQRAFRDGEMTVNVREVVGANWPCTTIGGIKDCAQVPKIMDECIHHKINGRCDRVYYRVSSKDG